MIGKIIALAMIATLLLGIVLPYTSWYASKTTFTDQVKEKWIKAASDSTSQVYLISTLKHGVLEDTDQILFLKFDSSDVYASIEPGKCYTFTAIGWRIPFLSWYPNILSLEPAAC